MQPYHYWGHDLVLSSTGDLARAEGTEEGQQRVLRRLLTRSRELVFHPDYGAGLPSFVGEVGKLAEIESLLIAQIHEEATVADDPPPAITLSPRPEKLSVRIQYSDAVTGQSEILSFSVDR